MDGGVLSTALFLGRETTIQDFFSGHITLVVFSGILILGWYSISAILVNNLWTLLRTRIESYLTLQSHRARQTMTHVVYDPELDEQLYRDLSIASFSVEAFLNGYVRFGLRVLFVSYFSICYAPWFSFWVISCLALGLCGIVQYCIVIATSDYQVVEHAYRTVWSVARDLLHAMPLVREARQEKSEESHLSTLLGAYDRAYVFWNLRFVMVHVWYHSIFFLGILFGWLYTHGKMLDGSDESIKMWFFIFLWLWVGDYLRVTTHASAVLFHCVPTLSRVLNAIAPSRHATTVVTVPDPDPSPGVVECRSVNFFRTLGPTIRDVSYAITAGSVVGLVSSSDEASIMVQLVARKRVADTGEILLKGCVSTTWTQQQIDHMLSYVGPQPILLQRTILDNLTYGAEKPVAMTLLAELVHTLHLTDLISRLPDGLNTTLDTAALGLLTDSERQLIAVGRALLSPTSLLILDRALDRVPLSLETNIVHYLCRNPRKRTTILVSSRFAALHAVDTIHVLDEGILIGSGTHHELLERSGKYRQMYFSQARLSLIAHTPKRG
jgi:ABC-type multidrug transport system fused ATPase/permease subunit